MTDSFPTMVYRVPGLHRGPKRCTYSFLGVDDKSAYDAALKAGWHRTIEDALAGGEVIKTADVEVDLTSPPTRKEMLQMARELGLKGAHLMKDDTLAARIKAAV